ncbi:MAG: DUF642 domain-containing protein [Chthoniobacterales bacterium]
MQLRPIILVLLSFCVAAAMDAQNLIHNGDFEAVPHDPSSTILDWDILGAGFIHSAMQGATSGSFAAALSIGGDSDANILSQTFGTTAGQAYLVQFDAGVFGVRTEAPLQLAVEVSGVASLLDQIVTPPDASTFDPSFVVFRHYRYGFIADSSSTTLQFTNIGLGNLNADVMVDTVSVVPTLLPPPVLLPLVNGDFETGPFDSNGTVFGWSVYGVSEAAIRSEAASSGSHSVAFGPGGDFQDDVLSQQFFTTSGRAYSIDFDAGVYGISDFVQMLRVRLIGNTPIFQQIINPPYFSTFNSSAVQLQHYHFVFTAETSISTIEFSNVGLENHDADVVLDSVEISPVPQTFAEWQSDHFDTNQLNNLQISGWAADPDKDGIANGLEYFFNTDPLAGIPIADANALPRTAIESFDGAKYLTFAFHQLLGWNGNPAVVQVSDDLVTWDTSGNQIELVSIVGSGDGETETVKFRLKTPVPSALAPKKFFRLSLAR